MDELIPDHEPEDELDPHSVALIEDIRRTLTIHGAMFQRILDHKARPSRILAELLEEASNRYMDFAELVSAASRASAKG